MPDLKKEKQDAEKGIFRIIHYLCMKMAARCNLKAIFLDSRRPTSHVGQ